MDPRTSSAAPEDAAFQPHVPADKVLPELTVKAVVVGTLLGLVFAASSLYLVLKVGMTVSATIPVAVLAITIFRAAARSSILENNIIQTAGSAGESIAFGVGVTMPALLMLGFGMDLSRVMVVAILGGLLGILAMIPLRRAFIVKMHPRPGVKDSLRYPEGVAAAQVLISGEKGGTTGQTVFVGFAIAFVHKFLTIGFNLLKETVAAPVTVINRAAVFAGDAASELLGVGYIIGVRTSAIMMGGAVLGYLVIIPLVYFIGQHAPTAVPPSPEKTIAEMDVSALRNNYLLYIGAGCVAAAGIISMCRTLPLIVRSVLSGMATVRGGAGPRGEEAVPRTERDMPMSVVLFGSLGLLVVLALFLMGEVGIISAFLGALLVLLFGFLFVTVSARLTGEIGSTSNPISGMTVATLLLTCLIFLALGMTSPRDRLLALSVAAVVCIAASNGGTTAQSLKTGFLVGGTPRAMQIAILIGSLVSALVIGSTLLAFNAAGTVYSDDPQYLPHDKGGQVVTLTPEELARLKKLTETETYLGRQYLVWDTRRDFFTPEKDDRKALLKTPEGTAPEGRFLVDADTGQTTYLVDPTISGKIKSHEGRDTTRFDAPKTQVMRIIIEGVLSFKLNWSLVLIGALIAVTLELCGVSALPFAVGIYVPIQYSTPIFIGGLVRWGVDLVVDRRLAAESEALVARRMSEAAALSAAARRGPAEAFQSGEGGVTGALPRTPQEVEREAREEAEIMVLRKKETSSGVLLASGYIAGGSLAGVAVAFLEFFPRAKTKLDMSGQVAGLGSVNDGLALVLFSVLAVFLVMVGLGKLFPQSEDAG
jgi:putative OPT family oligopeptide transporter